MIFFFIMIFLISLYIVFSIMVWKCNDDLSDKASALAIYNLFAFFILIFPIIAVMGDIRQTNEFKAAIINSIPTPALNSIITAKENELAKLRLQIEQQMNKIQLQVKIENFKGYDVIALPMSATTNTFQGLGDVERGGKEKLSLLLNFIDKQHQIIDEIIAIKQQAIRPEYYELNAKIMVMENSVFDGWLVKKFSIQGAKDLQPIAIANYYPN